MGADRKPRSLARRRVHGEPFDPFLVQSREIPVNAAGEAYKEELQYLNTGCPKEFDATKIVLAAAGSVLGDVTGNLVAKEIANANYEITHALEELDSLLEQILNSGTYGATQLPISIIPAATGGGY